MKNDPLSRRIINMMIKKNGGLDLYWMKTTVHPSSFSGKQLKIRMVPLVDEVGVVQIETVNLADESHAFVGNSLHFSQTVSIRW